MPSRSPAWRRRVVSARSSELGSGSPEGVIVGADESGGIQEDSRLEDFAGMHDAECQGAD